MIAMSEEFREFISGAVHDLRAPLRAIGVNADLLAATGNTECLQHIQAGVERMDSLLKDIAEYSHGEGRVLQMRPTKMDAALDEGKRQIATELRTSEAVITSDPLPVVTGDFLALAIVFRNLLSNACRFRSTEPPRIHVGAVQKDSEWHFTIRDNGIGFKKTYADTAFQPFKKLHGKHYPGSGLGLPQAKRIVEQHGGRMGAESSPGEGSTFWFTLPL